MLGSQLVGKCLSGGPPGGDTWSWMVPWQTLCAKPRRSWAVETRGVLEHRMPCQLPASRDEAGSAALGGDFGGKVTRLTSLHLKPG